MHVLGSKQIGMDTAADIVVMAQEDAIIIGHHIGADVGPDKGCQIFQGNHIAGVFQHLFLHRHAGLHHQDFPQGAIHHGINHRFRHALIVRYHQAGIVLPIQIALVIDLRQNIRRKDVIVQKIVVQFLCALFQRQPVPVHPMSFRIIEDRHHRHMDAPGMQMADALHIIHDVAEILEQGILAGLVEVGRAVQVIGLGRKGMGHIVIDAPDQHMVRQILHVFRSLGPAEGTENLAHGPALFLRVHMGQGGSKLSQIIMEKVIFHMFIADTAGAGTFRQTGDQLVQHNVDTGHILVCQGPEIMGCTVGGLGMGIVVLDDMANVLNSMFPAPGAQLGAEIAAVLPGNDVHVGIADPVGVVSQVIPQSRQQRSGIAAQTLLQHMQQLVVPGMVVKSLACPGDEGIFYVVAECRLVGEEAQEGVAEVFLQVLIMGLVHRIHKDLDRLLPEHIAVMGAVVIQTALGLNEDHDPPHALRQVEPHQTVFITIGNVQNLGISFSVGHMLQRQHRHDLILRGSFPAVRHHIAVGDRAGHIDMPLGDAPGPQVGIFFLIKGIVGIAGGEMLVVQDPDVHIMVPAPAHDQMHIGPPFAVAEVLVGPGLQTDGADAAVVNSLQLPGDQAVILPMEPQEGSHVVMLFSGQIVL